MTTDAVKHELSALGARLDALEREVAWMRKGVAHVTERDASPLVRALKDLERAYVNALENGRDRIIALGGDCDPVDVMERGDPYLRQSRLAREQWAARSAGEKP